MKTINQSIILFIGLVFSTQSTALKSDRDQPADIEADDIEFDFKNGTRTYNNNVLVVQGTLRLKADKLVGLYSGDDLDKATAWGSLARFKQRPDGKTSDVEGWAKKIIVDQKNNTLTLLGRAALKQGSDTARGETIVYNMANDTLKVKGGAKIGSSGKNGAAKPKRKIEDPFKDNAQGPASSGTTKAIPTTSDDDSSEATTESETDVSTEAKAQVEPLKAGRSRLIIQPKN